jgi:hypothetical protein
VPAKIHRIKLLEFERDELETIRDQKRGKTASAMAAVALLLSDEGLYGPALKDLEIREITGLSIRTIERLRERCCEVGPLDALQRKPRATPGREIKITGEVKGRSRRASPSLPARSPLRGTRAGPCA